MSGSRRTRISNTVTRLVDQGMIATALGIWSRYPNALTATTIRRWGRTYDSRFPHRQTFAYLWRLHNSGSS